MAPSWAPKREPKSLLRRPGGVLGASRGHLGSVLGRLGRVLGRFSRHVILEAIFHQEFHGFSIQNSSQKLNKSLSSIEKSCFFPLSLFEHQIAFGCDFGVNLVPLFARKTLKNHLGSPLGRLGQVFDVLGVSWAVLGWSWIPLQWSWGVLSASWAFLWVS